jgi:hypothetical protein
MFSAERCALIICFWHPLINLQCWAQAKTQGLTFYTSQHPDELRPLIQTIWEFLLPTLSTTFSDAWSDQQLWHDCLQGLVEAACLTCSLGLALNTSAFVRTLANFTSLHEPHNMRMPNVHALRKLLSIPDRVGTLSTVLQVFFWLCLHTQCATFVSGSAGFPRLYGSLSTHQSQIFDL